MTVERLDVSKLSDGQVSDLLGMGQSSTQPTVIELLRKVVKESSGQPLQILVADLTRHVLADDDGPLSFRRITGINKQESLEFEGKSFADMLTSLESSASALGYMVRFGNLLSSDVFPASTRVTGAVITSLAGLGLVNRHGVSTQSANMDPAMAVIEVLATQGAVPKFLRDFARSNTVEPH